MHKLDGIYVVVLLKGRGKIEVVFSAPMEENEMDNGEVSLL